MSTSEQNNLKTSDILVDAKFLKFFHWIMNFESIVTQNIYFVPKISVISFSLDPKMSLAHRTCIFSITSTCTI